MSDEYVPQLPSPSIREQFRKTAKILGNHQIKSEVSDEGGSGGSTKSYAQVESLVLPPNSSGLKPGSTKRKSRTTPFAVRLTEQQKQIIRTRAKAANRNVNEYIRLTVLGSDYRGNVDPEVRRAYADAYRELCRQGNNLNQIARQLNAETISPLQAESMLGQMAPALIAAYEGIYHALGQYGHEA